jgi:CubicO group peptidase (beta-lactamase class C family)
MPLTHRTTRSLFQASLLLLLSACRGDEPADLSPPPPPPTNRFAAIDQLVDTHRTQRNLPGVGLAIYDRNGTKVHEYMSGTITGDTRLPIASASKLVSGVTLFRLIEANYLTLDTRTGPVLGWQGANAGITLRHLLSFTSGLEPDALCNYMASITLRDCANSLEQQPLVAPPGTRFDYGSSHLAVAATMAEQLTGQGWNSLFQTWLAQPLGISADAIYYANPVNAQGTANPLPAGGLRMTMNEYARVLRVVFDRGTLNGSPFISASLFVEQGRLQYPNATVGNSPLPAGPGLRYGLTAWLDCDTPASGCNRISSPGAFGFTPWVDRDAGYYAVLGMYDSQNGGTGVAVQLEPALQPLIVEAMRQ